MFWENRNCCNNGTLSAKWISGQLCLMWLGFSKTSCEEIKRNARGFKSCSDDKAKNNQSAPHWSRRTGRRQKRFPPDHTLTTGERMWIQRARQKESRKKADWRLLLSSVILRPEPHHTRSRATVKDGAPTKNTVVSALISWKKTSCELLRVINFSLDHTALLVWMAGQAHEHKHCCV